MSAWTGCDVRPMSDPRPEHVAAIERRIMGWTATRGAQRLLITTDPDVLDAFLDALVRAGRLTEDLTHPYRGDDE
mgnify:CR=1 FL=1